MTVGSTALISAIGSNNFGLEVLTCVEDFVSRSHGNGFYSAFVQTILYGASNSWTQVATDSNVCTAELLCSKLLCIMKMRTVGPIFFV